jgi:hypothetical protein
MRSARSLAACQLGQGGRCCAAHTGVSFPIGDRCALRCRLACSGFAALPISGTAAALSVRTGDIRKYNG